MTEYSFVDLFSGAGGFTEGFLLAGNENNQFKLAAASDHHENAKLTHEHRFKHQLGLNYEFLVEDIRRPDFINRISQIISRNMGTSKEIDVVIGGPPCQGFSVFGLRNEHDPRNDLFLPYLKTIEHFKPKYFVMENVPGLVKMYGGNTVERIKEAVEKLSPVKYSLSGPIEINAADFGVPQLRERILFIGNREDMKSIDDVQPTHKGKYITVQQAIGDISFLNSWESNGSYNKDYPTKSQYQKESRRGRLFERFNIERKDLRLLNHEAAKHTPLVIARFAMIENGQGFESIPEGLWKQHLKTSKRWCVRLHPDKPSYTIVTLPDDLIHYKRHRILTVREMARLQSFDDTFEFLGPRASGGGGKGNKKRNVELPQYTQVGNAVPPLMAKGIAQMLLQRLAS